MRRLGTELLRKREYDKAIAAFPFNTREQPTDPLWLESPRHRLQGKGDRESAVKAFDHPLALNPSQAIREDSLEALISLRSAPRASLVTPVH